MSTKLYHAFELHLECTDDAAIMGWADQARVALVPVADDALRCWQVKEAIRQHDLGVLYDQPVPANGALAKVRQMGERRLQNAARGYREPDVDVQVSVRIIRDPQDGRLYGLRYVENDAMRHAFDALPGVHPAPYQNQTDDIPKGMTAAQWRARRDLWQRLLPADATDVGQVLELVALPSELPCPTEADVATHWTSSFLRISQILPEAVSQEMSLALQAGGEALTSSRAMRLAMESFERDHPLRAPMGEHVAEWLDARPLEPSQLR